MIISKKGITKALIRLRGCAGWSAPVLFANPRGQVFTCRGQNVLKSLKIVIVKANSADPDEMPHSGALQLGLHSSLSKDSSRAFQHTVQRVRPFTKKYKEYTIFACSYTGHTVLVNVIPATAIVLHFLYLSGYNFFSILHLSCRTNDLQFSLVLQTHALVL